MQLSYSNLKKENKWIFYGLKDSFITKSFIFSKEQFISNMLQRRLYFLSFFFSFDKYAVSNLPEFLLTGAAYIN